MDDNTQLTEQENKTLAFMQDLQKRYAAGGYIFRGVSKIYSEDDHKHTTGEKRVNSSLYRTMYKSIRKDPDIKRYEDKFFKHAETRSLLKFEKKLVDKTKNLFPSGTTNIEILSTIQHYGGQTLLIDFTQNILVALFFACYEHPNEDGELISLKRKKLLPEEDIYHKRSSKEDLREKIINPRALSINSITDIRNRINIQSSIFIHLPYGYLHSKYYESEPVENKSTILKLLRELHDITPESVFNDVLGFIGRQKRYVQSETFLLLSNFTENRDKKVRLIEKSAQLDFNNEEAVLLHESLKENTGDVRKVLDSGKTTSEINRPTLKNIN